MKAVLIRLFGGVTTCSPAAYEDALAALVDDLVARTDAVIVVLSHTGLDPRCFGSSLANLDGLAARAQAIVAARARTADGRVRYCDVTRVCRRWDDYLADRFHPNVDGHARIADAITAVVSLSPP